MLSTDVLLAACVCVCVCVCIQHAHINRLSFTSKGTDRLFHRVLQANIPLILSKCVLQLHRSFVKEIPCADAWN